MPFAQYNNTAAPCADDPAATYPTILPQSEHPTPVADPVARERAEQAALLRAVMATITHFFGPLSSLMTRVSDPRDPAKITYPLPALLFTGLLLFLCRLGSRRQVTHLLCGKASRMPTSKRSLASRCAHMVTP
jgi:hypothetical protein